MSLFLGVFLIGISARSEVIEGSALRYLLSGGQIIEKETLIYNPDIRGVKLKYPLDTSSGLQIHVISDKGTNSCAHAKDLGGENYQYDSSSNTVRFLKKPLSIAGSTFDCNVQAGEKLILSYRAVGEIEALKNKYGEMSKSALQFAEALDANMSSGKTISVECKKKDKLGWTIESYGQGYLLGQFFNDEKEFNLLKDRFCKGKIKGESPIENKGFLKWFRSKDTSQ